MESRSWSFDGIRWALRTLWAPRGRGGGRSRRLWGGLGTVPQSSAIFPRLPHEFPHFCAFVLMYVYPPPLPLCVSHAPVQATAGVGAVVPDVMGYRT